MWAVAVGVEGTDPHDELLRAEVQRRALLAVAVMAVTIVILGFLRIKRSRKTTPP